MKKIPHSRFLGLVFAIFAFGGAMGQTVTIAPSITSWSLPNGNNAADWTKVSNWSNGFANGLGSIGWLNFDINQNLSISDANDVGASLGSTAPVTINLSKGIPVANSLSVTDGVFYWSQSKGSNSSQFIVTYVPGSTSVSVAYNPAIGAGRRITVAYATTATSPIGPAKVTERVGLTDNQHTVFTKTLAGTPAMNSTFTVVTSAGYTWTCDGSIGNLAFGHAAFGVNGDPVAPSTFDVSFDRITRLLTVTYGSLANTSPTGGAITANYNPVQPLGITLGTLGLGDSSQNQGIAEIYNVRLNSLTFDNKGTMSNLIKNVGPANDEIASGIHLVGPLAIAARTGGDVNSALRLGGPIEGSGGLVKLDSGSVTLTGNNTFSGPTIFRDTGGNIFLRSGLTLMNCATTIASDTVTCSSTLGLAVGMTISGPNIQPNAVVTEVLPDGITFKVSPKANATATLQTMVAKTSSGGLLKNCVTTANSRTVTCESTLGLEVGMTLQGTNMTEDATVVSITNNTTFVMNTGATGTGTGITLISKAGNFSLSKITLTECTIPVNSSTVTCKDTTGLRPGMLLSALNDPGHIIPVNAAVLAVLSSTQFTITQPSTASGTDLTIVATSGAYSILGSGDTLPTITLAPVPLPTFTLTNCSYISGKKDVACNSTASLIVGQYVIGSNLTAGTTVASITDATHFVLSLAAKNTASGLNETLSIGTGMTVGSATVTCANTSKLKVGMVIYDTDLLGTTLPNTGTVMKVVSIASTTNINDTIHFNVSTTALKTTYGLNLAVCSATDTTSPTVVLCPSTASLATGMKITGPNIPVGATINTINSEFSFTMSVAATGRQSGLTLQVGSITTSGSPTVTVASTAGLATGMVVRGPGIPADTVITAVNASAFSFIMSRSATATASIVGLTVAPPPGLSLVGSSTTQNSTTVTTLSTASLSVGTMISGPNIPNNAVVTSITDATHFVMSAPATLSGSNLLLTGMTSQGLVLTNCQTSLSSATVTCDSTMGLIPGSLVSGPNMPDNAVVLSITDSTHFVLTSVAIGATTGSGVTLTATSGGYLLGTAGITITGASTTTGTNVDCPSTSNLYVGLGVAGPNMPAGAVITGITNSTRFVISAPVTGSGSGLTLVASPTGGVNILSASNTLLGSTITCASTVGLAPGMMVTGTNIPSAALIVSVTDATHFVISTPTPVVGSSLTLLAMYPNIQGVAVINASTTVGSPTITCDNTANLQVGQIVTGTSGIVPKNARITAITDTTHFTVNTLADGNGSGLTLLATQPKGLIIAPCSTVLGSANITCTGSATTANLVQGMAVTGANLPRNAVVMDVTDATHFTISSVATGNGSDLSFSAASIPTLPIFNAATTSGSPVVACASTSALSSGTPISGDGIPAGATVDFITSNTAFTLTAPASATASGLTLMATVPPLSVEVLLTNSVTYNNNKAVLCDNTAGLVVGMSVGGPNIPNAATVTQVVSSKMFLMSLPATADGWGLTLGGGTNAISSSQIFLGTASRDGNSSAVLQLQAANQIDDNSVIIFDGGSGRNPYLRTQGFNETMGGILDWTGQGVVENTESENGVFTSSLLTLTTAQSLDFNGFFRNRSGGDSTGLIGLTKLGNGTLGLAGGNVSYSGETTVRSGGLKLTNTTNYGSNIAIGRASTLELSTTSDWQLNQMITGAGTLIKTGVSQVTLANDNSMTGATIIQAGTLRVAAGIINQGLGSGDNSNKRFPAGSNPLTLSRFPAPGTLFFSQTDPTKAADANVMVSWKEGQTSPSGTAVTFDRAKNQFTIVYNTAPISGHTLNLAYRPADTQRVGNTNGSDIAFTTILVSTPVNGPFWYVTDGVDYWLSTSGTGTNSVGNQFKVDFVPGTLAVTVTYYSTAPAYGRAITAVWTGNEGLVSTSSITLNTGLLMIENQSRSVNTTTNVRGELNSGNRINDTATIFSNGGGITFRHNSGSDNYAETLGNLNLLSGMLIVQSNQADSGAGKTSSLTFGGLTRISGSGSTVLFSGNQLGQNTTNTQKLTTAPVLSRNGAGIIGGWAVVSDGPNFDFATNDTTASGLGLKALGSTNTRRVGISTWTKDIEAVVGGGNTATATKDTVVDSLNILDGSGRSVLLGGKTLTVNSGGVIFAGNTGGNAHVISGGNLTAGADSGYELFLWTVNQAQTNTISASIINNPSTGLSTPANQGMTVVKSGPGEVKLTGANRYTGGTRINGGDIEVTAIQSLGFLPAQNVLKSDFLLMNGGALQIPGKADLSASSLDFDAFHGITVGVGGGAIVLDKTVTSTIFAPITGPGGFSVGSNTVANQIDGGNVILSGDNTFDGVLQAIIGKVTIKRQAATPGGPITGSNTFSKGMVISAGADIVVHDGVALPVNPALTINGGTFTLGSSAKLGALTGIDGSRINLQDDRGTAGVDQVVTLGQTITMTVDQASNTTFAGTISDSQNAYTNLGIDKKGVGVLNLTPVDSISTRSDYHGPTRILEGVLAANSLGFRGSASALGSGSGSMLTSDPSAGFLYIENGAGLSYVGNVETHSNRPFTIGVGGLGAAIYANGNGTGSPLVMQQDILYHADAGLTTYYDGMDSIAFSRPNEAATLILGGRNIGENNFAMDLHDNGTGTGAKSLSLQKSGDGNWVLGQSLGKQNVTLTNCAIGVLYPAATPNPFTIYCDNTDALQVGMVLVGDPLIIPFGTFVGSIDDDHHTFTTSQPLTGMVPSASVTLKAMADSRNDFTGNTVVYVGNLAVQQNGALGAGTGAGVNLTNCSTTQNGTVVTCDSTAGLVNGMTLQGQGIRPGTMVESVTDATHFTINLPATLVVPLMNCVTIQGGTTVYCSTTEALAPGMAISGPGIAPGTTIVSILNGSSFTIDTPATAMFASVALTNCATTQGSQLVTCNNGSALYRGMVVTGPGLDAGTKILASLSNTSFLLDRAAGQTVTGSSAFKAHGSALVVSGKTTSGSTSVTSVTTVSGSNPADIKAGMALAGSGLNYSTTVASVTNDTSFELSAAPLSADGTAIDFTASLTLRATVSGPRPIAAAGGGIVQLIGGNLDLREVDYNSSKLLSLDGGRLRSLVGTNTWAGPIVTNVNSNVEVGPGSLLDLKGGISGRLGLTKLGFGTLSLEGTNTFAGGMNVNEGTLRLDYTTNHAGKLADGNTLTLGGGRKGATVDIVGNATGNVEVVNQVVLNLGQNAITRSDPTSNTFLRLNAITVNQGATFDLQYFPAVTGNKFTAQTDRLNEPGTGILGAWATVNGADWASVATGGTNDLAIIPYAGYLTNTWGGPNGNTNVTADSTQTGATTFTLRYGSPVSTTTTLVGDNTLRGGGILQAPAAGAVNNIITGGRIVLGNNFQGGNLLIQQNDLLGSLQINSEVTNAPDVSLHNAISYSGNVNNRFGMPPGLNTNELYLGMPVFGPNVRPGTVINFINTLGITGTLFQISSNIASKLSFDQGSAATPPPPMTFNADLRVPLNRTLNASRVDDVLGVKNQIKLTEFASPNPPLVVGQTVSGPGIPAGTYITAILAATTTTQPGTEFLLSNDIAVGGFADFIFGPLQGVNNRIHVVFPGSVQPDPNKIPVAGQLVVETGGGTTLIPAGTVISGVAVGLTFDGTDWGIDYLLSNDVSAQATGVSLTFVRWGELTVNNTFILIQEDIGSPGSPNIINTYQAHLTFGRNDGLLRGHAVSGLGIPAGATIFRTIGTTDFTYTFPARRTLQIGANTVECDVVASTTGATQGTEFALPDGVPNTSLGIVNGATPVSGPDIQPGTVVSSLVTTGPAAGHNFIVNRTIFAPIVDLTIQSRNGILKSGNGGAQVTGKNTFIGPVTITGGTLSVPTITDGGVAGPLGASSVAASNITIGGGTLQYTGNSAAVTRGFTINEVGAIDVANAGTNLNFTGNLSGGVGAALGTLQKVGMGTLQLSRTVTLGGATNFGAFEVKDGTLLLQYKNPNDGNPNDRFASTVAAVTMGGGKLELGGVADTPVASGGNPSEDRVQNLKGQLTLNTGNSQIWVTGASGSSITLNLQDVAAPLDVIRQPGGTVLFAENTNGGTSANITLALSAQSTGTVLPWATFFDPSSRSQPGVNNFAAIEIADNGVVSADSNRLYSTVSKVGDWSYGERTVTESGTAFSGIVVPLNGTTKAQVDAIRFFAKSTGVVTIANRDAALLLQSIIKPDVLTLQLGAILAGTNSGDNAKTIQGGQITSGLNVFGTGTNDLIIHNYNPAHDLAIRSEIIDYSPFGNRATPVNLVITGTGTTTLYGNNDSTQANFNKNSYTGTTFVTGGVLRLGNTTALPGGIGLTLASGTTGSNLVLDGGVVGLSNDFTRGLGAGRAQVQWTGSGGFAAYGVDAQVNLGAATIASTPATVIWGAGGFVPDSNELRLSSADATNRITLLNPINLGGVGRVVNVADGLADTDAQLTGGLSGSGGFLIKMGQGTLRVSGAQGTQSGGAVLAQGKLSASGGASEVLAGPLGKGALGIGNTDSSGAADSLVLELRNGFFNNPVVTVGNKNSLGITSINAVGSPTLSGTMSLDRHLFIGPADGRKITVGGSILDSLDALSLPTGNGGFTLVDGGVLLLNGDGGTLGSTDVAKGAGIKGSAVVRAGSLYVGKSTALGSSIVELGDVPANRLFVVDRSTAARSLLVQGGIYEKRSSGIPGTSSGSGGFIFSGLNKLAVDDVVYTEKDSLVDGDIDNGIGSHKRTVIMVNGEMDSPDRNGLYELVFHYGDSITLSHCSTTVNPPVSLVATTGRSSVNVSVASTAKINIGMMVTGPGIDPGTTVAAIVDGTNLTLSIPANATANNSTLVFVLGSFTVTCDDTKGLETGMPLFGLNVPASTVVNTVIDSQTFTMSNRALGVTTGQPFSARQGDTIGLNRIDEFNEPTEMVYGARVRVTNGLDAGKTFFLAQDVTVSKDETFQPPIPTYTPTWWKLDTVNPNVAFLANASGLTIANDIDINGANGNGSTSLGGSSAFGSGSSTFSGNVVLRNGSVTITGCATVGGSALVTTDSTKDLAVGMIISGNAVIPSGATVVSVINGSSFVISSPAVGADNAGLTLIASIPTATRTVRLLSDTSSGNGVVFSGIFSEADPLGSKMALQKLGTGTVTLSGANTYRGGTTVSSGTLLVDNGTGSATGTGAVTVSNFGTTLGGTGTISGSTTISDGAVLSPGYGSGVGLLTFGGNLTMGAGSSALFQLGLNDYDHVVVNGAFSVDPSAVFHVFMGATLDPLAYSINYDILSWQGGSIANLVDLLDLPSLVKNDHFWLSSIVNNGSESILRLVLAPRGPSATPVARFALRSARVRETTGSVVEQIVSIQLDSPATSAIFLPVQVTGTATAGTSGNLIGDFDLQVWNPATLAFEALGTGSTANIPFATGQTSADVKIVIHDDPITEPDETVVLTVVKTVDVQKGSPGAFTLTIADNDGSVALGTLWERQNPNPTNEKLQGIASAVTVTGASPVTTAVAVGSNGEILYSTDNGTTWKSSAVAAGTALHGVAAKAAVGSVPAVFVAVGDNGLIVTSPDGKAWTYHNASGNKVLNGVTWASALGLFVTVGENGVIYTSPDGKTWTYQDSGLATDLAAVTFANSLLVAVGQNGAQTTSSDGVTWTAGTAAAPTDYLRAVTFKSPLFVAVGDSGVVTTSSDGLAWTKVPSSGISANLRAVFADSTKFYAAGVGGALYSSTTGTSSWNVLTLSTIKDDLQAGLVVGSNKSLVVGASGMIITNNSGLTWTRTGGSAGTTVQLNTVASNGTTFVVSGLNGVKIAADHIDKFNPTASPGSIATTPQINAIAAGGGTQLVAVGDGGVAFVSPTGVSWTATSTTGTSSNLRGLTYFGGSYYAVGDGRAILKGTVTGNAVAWTSLTPGDSENLFGIAFNGSKYVAVGDNATVLTSSDGSTWESTGPDGLGLSLTKVIWTGSQFVIVGAGGTVLTTPDGVVFSKQPTGISANLNDVVATSSALFAVGAGGTILTSPLDGLTWKIVASGTSQDLRGIAYSGGDSRLVAVGVSGTVLSSLQVNAPPASAYFAQSSMTVDERIGVAMLPIYFTQIPTHDLYMTFTASNTSAKVTLDYTTSTPFKVAASSITSAEIAAGAMTRYLPVTIKGDALNSEGTETVGITISDFLLYSAGKPVVDPVTKKTKSDTAVRVEVNSSLLTLTITDTVPPTVNLSPATQHQMLELGQPIHMVSTVTGSGPTIQWLRNGGAVAKATADVLDILAVTSATVGAYSVKVSNPAGSDATTKHGNVVVVAPAGTIEVSAVDKTNKLVLVKSGGSTILSAVAYGNGLTYAWYLQGNPTPLATGTDYTVAGSKLTLKNVTAGHNEGDFYCTVMQNGTGHNTGLSTNTGTFHVKQALLPDIAVPSSIPVGKVGAPYYLKIPRATGADPLSANTPTSFTPKGLPAGLGINALGEITGTPTAAAPAPGATVTITATNAAGTTAPPITFSLIVEPLDPNTVGSFMGLVARSGSPDKNTTTQLAYGTLGLGAWFKVDTVAAGTFSGKIVVGATTYPFTGGKLVTTAPGAVSPQKPKGSITVARGVGKSSLVLSFEIDPPANLITGTVTDANTPVPINTSASLTGWRNQGAATASIVNFFADIAGGPPTDGSLPEGASYASITVGANGTAVVAGKTADGSVIATSGYFGPSGQVFVYSAFYTVPGSIAGVVNVDKVDPVVQRATGSLSWSHPRQTTGRTFAAGWPQAPITLAVDGGKYYPATAASVTFADGTNIPMNLPDNSAFTDKTNAQLTFSGANVPGTASVSALRLQTPPALAVLPTGAANPTSTTLTVTNSSGAFTGSFTLSDGRGKITYQGLIVPVISTATKKLDGVGYGYFLLQQSTAAISPYFSGLVILEAKR